MALAEQSKGPAHNALEAGWAAVTREGLAAYAVTYLAVALFGAAAIPQLSEAETIWPAFGVYLAGLIRRDPKHWPALVALTLCADFALGQGLLGLSARESGLHAIEFTLEASTAAYLLHRYGGVWTRVHSAKDVLVLIGATCVAAPSVGASFEIATSAFAGAAPDPVWARYVDEILPSLIVAPLAVLALGFKLRPLQLDWRRFAEATALLAALVAICSYALGNEVQALFLTILPVIWAAKRFGTIGASAVLVLIAVFATNFLAQGRGPFAVELGQVSLNVYLGVVAGVGLMLAAAKNEREEALEALRAAGDELEDQVAVRTQELAASEEKLRLAAEAVGFGAYEYDIKNARAHLSEQARRVWGAHGPVVTREQLVQAILPEDAEAVLRAKGESFASGSRGEGEIEYRLALPGEPVRWVHDKWRVLFDDNGAPIRAIGAIMDITERKQLEERLRQTEVEAEREGLQSVLLSSVSHDLRTPIATIIASATSLQAHEDTFGPDIRRQMHQEIVIGAERLDRYVANLLAMTRLESGVVDPQSEALDPAEVMRGGLAYLERRFAGRDFALSFETGGALVLANRVLLEQAFVNLLENAIAYSPAGSTIRVSAVLAGGEVVVTVDDEGSGIAAGELELVFEKFFRSQSDRRRSAGIGLGLSVVRGIVEAFGGAVSAKSPICEGRGTRMEIRLPAYHAPPL